AAAFSDAAQPYQEAARKAEASGDGTGAREAHLAAYGYLRVARYPAPNSPAKQEAYRRSQEHYLAAGRYLDPPIERVEMPFTGRPSEGDRVIGLLRRPPAPTAAPVLVSWGGIDSFKEERRLDAFFNAGYATLAI